MNRIAFSLLGLFIAMGFTSCESLSTDPAPGGISASETGMSVTSAREWQDRAIRQLAY